MEKIAVFIYEQFNFPSHNEYLEFDGCGKYSCKRSHLLMGSMNSGHKLLKILHSAPLINNRIASKALVNR